MSEFTTIANEGVPVVEHDPSPHPEDDASPGQPDAGLETTVTALLRGGPAAGKQIRVPRVAGTFPLFIGVDGGNYVRDKGTHDHAVYNWWPKDASHPAGDPTARSDAR